jgi:uncharacterized protein YkwD
MNRRAAILGLLSATVAACTPTTRAQIGPDGLPLPQIYRIAPDGHDAVMFHFLDGMNALRKAAQVQPVAYNAQLNAAATTHSRDMAVQNRPWHFGSDGSSPLDRGRRVGYSGRIMGENISETYETELETLAAWMKQEDTRAVILDPTITAIGFAWYQEPAGKIWWTLVTGR